MIACRSSKYGADWREQPLGGGGLANLLVIKGLKIELLGMGAVWFH